MTGYDFDKTIYNGNSFVDFYFYCLFLRPYILLLLPYQLIVSSLYIFGMINRKIYKEQFHCYLLFLFGKEKLMDKFWQKHIKKIKNWYLQQKQANDVIVSATPKFFLQKICDLLGIQNLVATEMDVRTGKIKGDNCIKQNKVKMFRAAFGEDAKLKAFYSDSKADIPMMRLAEKAYFVYGDVIEEYHC